MGDGHLHERLEIGEAAVCGPIGDDALGVGPGHAEHLDQTRRVRAVHVHAAVMPHEIIRDDLELLVGGWR
jgi:hypothetical protein